MTTNTAAAAAPIATLQLYPKQKAVLRTFALWYFTTLITVWNILGHTVLGFEQSWLQPLVAVATCLVLNFFLDWLDARATGRRPRFLNSVGDFLNFLPTSIIPGLACAMLLYGNETLIPVIFAAALSICSKVMFRVPMPDGRSHHVFNPSNFGIVVTLICFPWVGLAPPYHFTENLTGFWHWALPMFIIFTGLIVHGMATGRLVLVLAWLVAFVIQGQIRRLYFDFPWYLPLTPMTSASFVVFTLYMIPDPATTPIKFWRQVAFAFCIATIYGTLQVLHLVFGLFIALVLTCGMRGLWLYAEYAIRSLKRARSSAEDKGRLALGGAGGP